MKDYNPLPENKVSEDKVVIELAKPSPREQALAAAVKDLLDVIDSHGALFARLGVSVREDVGVNKARELVK
jgi:hypothetical protein